MVGRPTFGPLEDTIMHGAKELIGRLQKEAGAAFWIMPAAVLLLAILPAFFALSTGFRVALAALLLLCSLGVASRAASFIRKLCASLQEAGQQPQAEDEKSR